MGFSNADIAEAVIGGLDAGVQGYEATKRPTIPPSPVIPQAQVDQQAELASQQARQRQSIAGGISSTVGTPGGQAGEALNPANLGGKTLLGQ